MNQMEEKILDNKHPYHLIFIVNSHLSTRDLFIWKEISKEKYTTEEDILEMIKSVFSRHNVLGINFARFVNDKVEHPCTISCINKKPSEDQLLEFSRDVYILTR